MGLLCKRLLCEERLRWILGWEGVGVEGVEERGGGVWGEGEGGGGEGGGVEGGRVERGGVFFSFEVHVSGCFEDFILNFLRDALEIGKGEGSVGEGKKGERGEGWRRNWRECSMEIFGKKEGKVSWREKSRN